MSVVSCFSYEVAFLRDKQGRDASDFQVNKIEIIRQRFEQCKRMREGKHGGLDSGLGLGLGLQGIGETISWGGASGKHNEGHAFLL